MDSDTVKNGGSNGVIAPAPQQDRKQRKDKSSKRKEDKSVESVMKALEQLPSSAEKFDVLRSKYAELADESKKYQLMEKKLVMLQREKDQIQQEHTKSTITRSRIEQLCRELQKQNKAIKEESLLKIKDEEEKRKELSAKFNATMTEITALMQQNSESNSKLRDENLSMQNQFKGVCEQYELREQQVEKMGQQMKLESQLAEAKLSKAHLELKAQQDVMEREKAILMAELARCQAKCLDHEKIEATLRAQINVYFEKYDEFQTVLNKSNQVYAGFKTEMDKMSKKITRLEKETASWKQKWEATHKVCLSLAAEKQIKDNEVAQQSRQLDQLQKLCRTLQTERTTLLQQLAAAGITPAKAQAPDSTDPKPATESTNLPVTEAAKATETSPTDLKPVETSETKPVGTGAAEKTMADTKLSADVVKRVDHTGDGSVEETVAAEVDEPLKIGEKSAGDAEKDLKEPLVVTSEELKPAEVPEKVPSVEDASSCQVAAAVAPTVSEVKAVAEEETEPSVNIEPRVPPQDEKLTASTPAVTEIVAPPSDGAKPPNSPSSSNGVPSSNAASSSATPATPKSVDKSQQSKKTPPQTDQKKMKEGSKRRNKK